MIIRNCNKQKTLLNLNNQMQEKVWRKRKKYIHNLILKYNYMFTKINDETVFVHVSPYFLPLYTTVL